MGPDEIDALPLSAREPTGPWPPLPPPELGGPPYDDDAPFGAEEDDVKKSSKDGPHGPIRHESHPVALTDEELLERGQTLAEKLRLVAEAEERAKDEAKRLKDLVKEAQGEALAVRIVVENKAERRQVEVQDFVDWATRTMETRRLDKPVGESVVRTRPLTAQEIAEIEQGTEGLFARAKKDEARLDEAREPSAEDEG